MKTAAMTPLDVDQRGVPLFFSAGAHSECARGRVGEAQGLITPVMPEAVWGVFFSERAQQDLPSEFSRPGSGHGVTVSAVGIGSGGHNVPHISSSCGSGCSHHRLPRRAPHRGSGSRAWSPKFSPKVNRRRSQPVVRDSRVVLAQHLRRPCAATFSFSLSLSLSLSPDAPFST